MRKIDIKITKSQLEGFNVSFDVDEKKINVSATIGLYTNNNKKISEYSVSTEAWNEEKKFSLPLECITPIMSIADEIERLVTLKCREGQKLLKESNE